MTLVDVIRARAALPLEQARALPGECYTSDELYALEVSQLFRTEWICVAHVAQLPEPGDWLAVDLVGEPLVITRDGDGSLHAVSRVCAHRAQDVLNEVVERQGNAARLTCPYHLWSYRLDGSCIGAPDMAESEVFDPATSGLGTFALETWQGFVFVNLASNPTPLAATVAGIDAVLGDLRLDDWKLARTLPWGEQPANWKIAVENAIECYHHMGPHRETLEPLYPHTTPEMDVSTDDHWMGGYLLMNEAYMVDGEHPRFFAQAAPGASAKLRSALLIAGVYPMFFMALLSDAVAWFDWLPTGTRSHRLDIRVLIPPAADAQPDRDAILDAFAEGFNHVQAEDARNNEGVQRSMTSVHATGGPLSRLEAPIWHFQRYLAARLA